jgi:hypothetical protein
MARPTLLNSRVAGRLVDLIAGGATVEEAALELGCSRRAVFAWMARDGELRERVRRAREERPPAPSGHELAVAVAENRALFAELGLDVGPLPELELGLGDPWPPDEPLGGFDGAA